MSDNTRLDNEVRVIAEFGDVSDGTSYVEHGMAREILRLRRILAALREPSEGVLRTVFIATFGDNPVHKEACLVATQNAIRAAVTAAEQEVGG